MRHSHTHYCKRKKQRKKIDFKIPDFYNNKLLMMFAGKFEIVSFSTFMNKQKNMYFLTIRH